MEEHNTTKYKLKAKKDAQELAPRFQASFCVGGRLVELKRKEPRSYPMKPREKEQKILTYTRESRNRMLKTLLSIDYSKLPAPAFVTLTYPGEYSQDPRAWKKDLKTFNDRQRKRHPGYTFIWRLEPQKRGAPHFSGFMWGIPGLGTEKGRKGISRDWYEVVGSQDERHLRAGTQVIILDEENRRKKIYYLAKYMSKSEKGTKQEKFDYPVGRYWGIEGRKNLPIQKETIEQEEQTWTRIRRVIRKKLERYGKKKTYSTAMKKQNNGIWCEMTEITFIRLYELFHNHHRIQPLTRHRGEPQRGAG